MKNAAFAGGSTSNKTQERGWEKIQRKRIGMAGESYGLAETPTEIKTCVDVRAIEPSLHRKPKRRYNVSPGTAKGGPQVVLERGHSRRNSRRKTTTAARKVSVKV